MKEVVSFITLVTSGIYIQPSLTYMYGIVTYNAGLVYTYLARHVGHFGDQGAFRALTHGYTHWASGRLQEMEVNTKHPSYCHIRCTTNPSMRDGVYKVYLLLGREGELATICSATCECSTLEPELDSNWYFR